MGKLNDLLARKRILLGDGAWGTFLHTKGLQPGECPEAWNISRPEEVQDIAARYIEAGSDIIETNSFGASRLKLDNYGLGNDVYKINFEAARISRSAAGPSHLVLGSIGPTGKILMTGDTNPGELYGVFREQAMALEKGGADALIIETMSDIEEARIAARAARENTSCDVVVSFTFARAGDKYHTMMGITPEEMTRQMLADGFRMIGSNCGNGIEDMLPVVEKIKSVDQNLIIMIQANAGQPNYRNGKTIFPETPDDMLKVLPKLISGGVRIVGGCCGTEPSHIRAFRRYIDENID